MLKMVVIGNIGKDAESKEVNGQIVVNFHVAHTEKFTSNGEKKERTIWVSCAQWRSKEKGDKIVEYLKKGTKVYVEGYPTVETYTDGNNNVIPVQKLNVKIIELLSGAKAGAAESEHENVPTASGAESETGDDLPF